MRRKSDKSLKNNGPRESAAVTKKPLKPVPKPGQQKKKANAGDERVRYAKNQQGKLVVLPESDTEKKDDYEYMTAMNTEEEDANEVHIYEEA